jgi:hypothetical protein
MMPDYSWCCAGEKAKIIVLLNRPENCVMIYGKK